MASSSIAGDLALNNELEMVVEREQEKPPERPPLEKFVPKGSSLYEAIEFVLLGSPRRQMMQNGDSISLEKVADDSAKARDRVGARINYESAARVALYERDRERFRRMVERAEEFTSDGQRFSMLHKTLLENLNDILRIATEYYDEFEKRQDSPGSTAHP